MNSEQNTVNEQKEIDGQTLSAILKNMRLACLAIVDNTIRIFTCNITILSGDVVIKLVSETDDEFYGDSDFFDIYFAMSPHGTFQYLSQDSPQNDMVKFETTLMNTLLKFGFTKTDLMNPNKSFLALLETTKNAYKYPEFSETIKIKENSQNKIKNIINKYEILSYFDLDTMSQHIVDNKNSISDNTVVQKILERFCTDDMCCEEKSLNIRKCFASSKNVYEYQFINNMIVSKLYDGPFYYTKLIKSEFFPEYYVKNLINGFLNCGSCDTELLNKYYDNSDKRIILCDEYVGQYIIENMLSIQYSMLSDVEKTIIKKVEFNMYENAFNIFNYLMKNEQNNISDTYCVELFKTHISLICDIILQHETTLFSNIFKLLLLITKHNIDQSDFVKILSVKKHGGKTCVTLLKKRVDKYNEEPKFRAFIENLEE
jgi:hypothetical protein